jgi:hypothetical protein
MGNGAYKVKTLQGAKLTIMKRDILDVIGMSPRSSAEHLLEGYVDVDYALNLDERVDASLGLSVSDSKVFLELDRLYLLEYRDDRRHKAVTIIRFSENDKLIKYALETINKHLEEMGNY